MEWTQALGWAIRYMEDHLREPITVREVAAQVHLSPFYLQKGFQIVTGYSIAKYLRCRRLYLAALDLAVGGEKVLDVALRYGFETPESFTKAFTRFHGATPSQVRKDRRRIKAFLPLKIIISVQGGEAMEYRIERMEGFRVIGLERTFSTDTSYAEIPKFWDEFAARYMDLFTGQREPETPLERAILENHVSEYGVCIDEEGMGSGQEFRYLIAGRYEGGEVPEGLTLYEFPAMDWAIFPCTLSSLQPVNTRIFNEWLPGNPEYEIAMGANVEWYSPGDPGDSEMKVAIWLPVKKK